MVCMHYPIPKLIFDWGISASFTSNIFRAPQDPCLSSQKWPASLHSLIGSGEVTTAVWVDIMVSDIKSTLTFPKPICCRLKKSGIQTHTINNLPQAWGYTVKANLEVLLEAFSRLIYFYLTVSNFDLTLPTLGVLWLRSRPVQAAYLPVMTTVSGVSYAISHGLGASIGSSVTCTLYDSFLGSLY